MLCFCPSILPLSLPSLLSSFLFLLGGEMVQVKLELVHPFLYSWSSGLRKPLKSFKQEVKRSDLHFEKWIGKGKTEVGISVEVLEILRLGDVSACSVTQLCPTLYNTMNYSPPGSSVHGIIPARILEQVAISYFSRSSQSRDWTRVSCIARRTSYHWTSWESPRLSNEGWLWRWTERTRPDFWFIELAGWQCPSWIREQWKRIKFGGKDGSSILNTISLKWGVEMPSEIIDLEFGE